MCSRKCISITCMAAECVRGSTTRTRGLVGVYYLDMHAVAFAESAIVFTMQLSTIAH